MVPPARQAADGCDGADLVLVVSDGVVPVRVLVAGVLDISTAPRLARCLGQLVDVGHRRIDLDLAHLGLLSAAGLTVFSEARVRLQEAGGRLRLTAVPPRARRILTITGLDTVFDLEARSAVAPRGTPGGGGGAAWPASPTRGARDRDQAAVWLAAPS